MRLAFRPAEQFYKKSEGERQMAWVNSTRIPQIGNRHDNAGISAIVFDPAHEKNGLKVTQVFMPLSLP
jgi:hypothetical protein